MKYLKTRFATQQTLGYQTGRPHQRTLVPTSGAEAQELLKAENQLLDNSLVELTYGPPKPPLQPLKEPQYLKLDKKVLCFFGYYREEIPDCTTEPFRIHQVKILYYLVDDTMEVVEPRVPNSGLPQGLLIKRHSFPRPDGNIPYYWKDLNLGKDICVYGKKFRITDCDPWTREYCAVTGMELGSIEEIPEDPHTKRRHERDLQPQYITPQITDDKVWRFQHRDRQVLRFYGTWDDILQDPIETRNLIILYYLLDDTMEILEVHKKNCGRDNCPVLVRRQKFPIDLTALPETFPIGYMEYGDQEVKDGWFTPKHFGIGKTVLIFNRKIFIYNCDDFTRRYYKTHFGVEMPQPIDSEEKPKPKIPLVVPPHTTGLGTWEDSLQSCLSVRPKRPKKDMLKMYHNDDKFLRYSAFMDTVWPIDRSRRFVITFFPGDDTITIFESCIPNSGISGGSFLKKCNLKKASGPPGDDPKYYTASDLYIGATICASGRKFIITDADRYVLTFMEEHPHIYPKELIEIHRKKAGLEDQNKPIYSEREALVDNIRRYILENCDEEPKPITLELGHYEWPRDIVEEKVFTANLPISRELLEKALDISTAESGKIDVDELRNILLQSFGQKTE